VQVATSVGQYASSATPSMQLLHGSALAAGAASAVLMHSWSQNE